jgi:AraC family transcriptional regulator of adaptative response / DNA-3-methyladenine glycosylase II
MRALGDPDAFLPSDLGVVLAARALGLGEQRALVRRSERWAPYRAYAVQHLWAVGDHPVNHLPVEDSA